MQASVTAFAWSAAFRSRPRCSLAPHLTARLPPLAPAAAADKTSIVCSKAVGGVSTPNGILSLQQAVKGAQGAPLLALDFKDIEFTGAAFAEAAQVGSAPACCLPRRCALRPAAAPSRT